MTVQYPSTPMNYDRKIKDPVLLCHGQYEGFDFYIYNLGGYPTAYVGLPKGHPLYNKTLGDIELTDIDVHGGITYAEPYLTFNTPEGWYIGWDYAHMGDYRTSSIAMLESPGHKYTTEEMIDDCESVIDAIKNMKE